MKGKCSILIQMLLFQLVQIVYWIALSTWFGGVLFIAVAVPVIYRIIRESTPILPTVLSVNLENQHGMLLAGNIVSELLAVLFRIEIICAGGLLVSMIVQFAQHYSTNTLGEVLRGALFLAAAGLAGYDWRVVAPRIAKFRAEFMEHADEPERAKPAMEQFDRYQRESFMVLMILVGVLLAMILFSADMTHGVPVTYTFPAAK
jgi:hypothetical protein